MQMRKLVVHVEATLLSKEHPESEMRVCSAQHQSHVNGSMQHQLNDQDLINALPALHCTVSTGPTALSECTHTHSLG
jgi:hypothetical protein